jgi:hypothetical protein
VVASKSSTVRIATAITSAEALQLIELGSLPGLMSTSTGNTKGVYQWSWVWPGPLTAKAQPQSPGKRS